MPAETTVRVAEEAERREALELTLRPLPAASRAPLLDSLAGGVHLLEPLEALIVAVRANHVVAAAWGQPSPGRATALWLPEWQQTRPADATDVEVEMIRAINSLCDAATVPMTQVLCEIEDDPRIPALEAAGFASVATLDYLGRSIGTAALPAPNEAGPLDFVPYDRSQHDRLKQLIAQTYIGSLDCPGLDELRDLDDVLIGYGATGHHDPLHWLFVQEEGVDIGVLLLAEHPDADQAELIYMGVTPVARGRGHGIRIVDHALAVAQQMGVEHLMVAVDRANAPARRVYDRAVFAAWARRHVYVRARDGRSIPT